jgi:uncharacterized cupredoxin-like copper-binding protein
MTGAALLLANPSAGGRGEPGDSRNVYGAPIPTVGVEVSEFNVTVSELASAPSGNVRFAVKNAGGIEHELIVLKTSRPFDALPVVDSGDPPVRAKSGADKVDELRNVGETGDPNLKPGQTRTFLIKNLAPGRYALVCNLARHYGLGMRAAFTVTDPRYP